MAIVFMVASVFLTIFKFLKSIPIVTFYTVWIGVGIVYFDYL